MKKMGKQVSESSEQSVNEEPEQSVDVLESGDQVIPVMESEQLIGNGLVTSSKVKEVTSSQDDDFSEDFEASASLEQKKKSPLVTKPQKLDAKPKVMKPIDEKDDVDNKSDDFADGEIKQQTIQKNKLANAEKSISEEEVDEEIDDEFSDGDVEEPTEVVVHKSNVAEVEKELSVKVEDEDEDDDFADGEVEEPTEAIVEDGNMPKT